ncbi:MAG: YitT family protein [Spirochaetaceae bacterium]|jgi:uncharacterized membrane-anchored protein YitT (DUF2179 family)|nr:YitT family protein [Spirochaetaceae bacterium]
MLAALRRLALIVFAAVLMAFNLKTFVHAGALIPGGFTGLTLLIQEICLRFGNFRVPFSVVLYTLNAVPALICYKFIGKNFALYSILMIVICGLLTDFMPAMFIEKLQVQDSLLSAVFGGLLNALSISLCLYAGATSGGTDFIAIFISEKYRRDAWNYIFAGNCVILAAAALLFTLDKALYSIIFQFTTTIALSSLYRGYQQRTLFIITSKPDEIYALIREKTNHGATSFKGHGFYEKKDRVLLYSVVAADEAGILIRAIKAVDYSAFINVIKTEHLNGRFFQRPRD